MGACQCARTRAVDRLNLLVYFRAVQDVLSSKFAALGDPTRRAILRRLMRSEATLTQLAKPFAMSVPAVAKHVRVLEDAGLVERGARRHERPIRMKGDALSEMTDWIDHCRKFWQASFDRLEAMLDE